MAVYWNVSPDAPVLSGHWMCAKSIMTGMHCFPPREVTKVSRTTVSWNDGVDHGTIGKNRVEFFADSEAEALAVYELEKAKYDAIRYDKKRITAEFEVKIEAIAPK
jgi:hypothetical protein